MGFSKKLLYFLVHQCAYTNADARTLLASGQITVNGETVRENILHSDQMEICIAGRVIQHPKKHLYLKFYKPRGFQSSLNPRISDGLSAFFTDYPDLAIAGRLDKDSEGLLLLSNDGKWIEKICHPNNIKEKEYVVELNQRPSNACLERFTSGMQIAHQTTRPCYCGHLEGEFVRVILTEGKNRQIRRMFHQLGYQVHYLKRIRVDTIQLGNLPIGKYEAIFPLKDPPDLLYHSVKQ